MPPAGGSLVSDVPYPATLYLESYGASTHIEGEVVATPEPTSLLAPRHRVLIGDG
jgi:hypothetical protein